MTDIERPDAARLAALRIMQHENLRDWRIEDGEPYCWLSRKVITWRTRDGLAAFLHEVAHALQPEPEGNQYHHALWGHTFTALVGKYMTARGVTLAEAPPTAALREALSWYAGPDNWKGRRERHWDYPSPAVGDNGARARATLAHAEGEPQEPSVEQWRHAVAWATQDGECKACGAETCRGSPHDKGCPFRAAPAPDAPPRGRGA